jgi:hypothetical protein
MGIELSIREKGNFERDNVEETTESLRQMPSDGETGEEWLLVIMVVVVDRGAATNNSDDGGCVNCSPVQYSTGGGQAWRV